MNDNKKITKLSAGMFYFSVETRYVCRSCDELYHFSVVSTPMIASPNPGQKSLVALIFNLL
jgi:hypothetical protein